MTDRILTLAQVFEEGIVPLAKSTLYEVAREPGSPFWMRGGRWLTVESDLRNWVRQGPKVREDRNHGYGDPVPRPRRGSLLREVEKMERRS